ncbi:MAG: hypothetical protein V4617_01600 [Gemmatimonadota bacterium]
MSLSRFASMSRASLSAASLLLLVACDATERRDTNAGNSTRSAVLAGDSARSSASPSRASSQRGEITDGDERGTWLLTSSPDGGFTIEDDVQFGDDGRANRLFRFDAKGALRFATEQRTITAQSGASSPTTVHSELQVDFSASAPVATKRVDDLPREAAAYEIDNLRRRAELLRTQAHR